MNGSSPAHNQPVMLIATHHDPPDSMLAQSRRVLPVLQAIYGRIVVVNAPGSGQRTTEMLRDSGVEVRDQTAQDQVGLETLGLARHDTLRVAAERDAAWMHLCDWDRAIHWAEQYPDELRTIAAAIPRYDLLVLGRTPRAFGTHPLVQRETERLVNHVFGLAFGQELDVTAASRGLSRRAIDALLELENPEPTVGNDCAWPLFLAREPDMVIGYAATEGLEWETPDRFADEIIAAGGLDAWIDVFDAEPGRWEFRTRLALHELEAINRWR